MPFYPAPIMKLVELIRAKLLDETYETAKDFAELIGKQVVEAPDCQGSS